MNPVLTISALNTGNSIENNMLSPSSGVGDGVTNQLFEGEFSELLGDLVSSDGKLKPLDLAALKEMGFQELGDLQALTDLKSASDTAELNQLSILSLLAKTPETQIQNAELFGNPEVKTSLTSNQADNQLSEENLFLA